MDIFKEFLENSSINGMSLISTTKRFTRLFWIMIVIVGFSGSIFMIFESFENWREKPISTTIETFPISEITFPNVTVCPPGGLFLNLNQDIRKSETVELNEDLRNELLDYALEVIQDQYYLDVMANLSKLVDPDSYYNRYHGYNLVKYPYYNEKELIMKTYVYTYARSGNISTQYLGDKFHAANLDLNHFMQVKIYIPTTATDSNTVLMIYIEKNSITQFINGDVLYTWPGGRMNPYITNWSRNFSINDLTKDDKDDRYYFKISLKRDISEDEMNSIDLEMMPGFRVTWNIHGLLELKAEYSNLTTNGEFTRFFNSILKLNCS